MANAARVFASYLSTPEVRASDELFAMCCESLGMLVDILHDSSVIFPAWGKCLLWATERTVMFASGSSHELCVKLAITASLTNSLHFLAHVLDSLRELFPKAPPGDNSSTPAPGATPNVPNVQHFPGTRDSSSSDSS